MSKSVQVKIKTQLIYHRLTPVKACTGGGVINYHLVNIIPVTLGYLEILVLALGCQVVIVLALGLTNNNHCLCIACECN